MFPFDDGHCPVLFDAVPYLQANTRFFICARFLKRTRKVLAHTIPPALHQTILAGACFFVGKKNTNAEIDQAFFEKRRVSKIQVFSRFACPLRDR
jgi:hypothetical protein